MGLGPAERRSAVRRLDEETFDAVVLGGGITGAGILREAALRGLRVALLEKSDFASGTSSRSSKLVHGGLRYLEQYRFHLVWESTHERSRLMRLARHVVRPLPFLMPVFRDSRHGLGFMDLGMWLYDALGAFRNYRNHRRLDAGALLASEPLVRADGLAGGLLYYDAVTDDARLTLENVLSAAEHGATAVSRCEVRGVRFRDGRVTAVLARDLVSGADLEVRTRCVICAAGPWTGSALEALDAVRGGPRLRPTKGAHLVLPFDRLPLRHAVVMVSPRDGRVMFTIPWHGATVIGTTDTDFAGGPDAVFADRWDVDYLLETVNHHVPSAGLGPSDVVGTWAGLRPLIAPDGDGDGTGLRESDVSREEVVTADPRGIVTIAGGKLTTYRLMAIQAVTAALPFVEPGSGRRRSRTARLPLLYCGSLCAPGADLARTAADLASDRGLPADVSDHLVQAYGASAAGVLDLAAGDRGLLERLDPALPFLRVEVLHACRNEAASTLDDVFCRRMQLFFLKGDQGLAVAPDAAAIMAAELGWDEAARREQVERLAALAEAHLAGCARQSAPQPPPATPRA